MLPATIYLNEPEVGEALAEAFRTGLALRERGGFITAKAEYFHLLWPTLMHTEAGKDSLKKPQLDYLDLCLGSLPCSHKA
ncbi:NADP-dependent oxidoreductase domain containing protein, partial [Trema orientale]